MQRMTDCVEEVDLDEVIPLKDGESQSCCPTTKAISSYGLEDGSNPQPYSDLELTWVATEYLRSVPHAS